MSEMDNLTPREREKLAMALHLIRTPAYGSHSLEELAFFQEVTAYSLEDFAPDKRLPQPEWEESPQTFRLPEPKKPGKAPSYRDVLHNRRSRRDFRGEAISLHRLSALLADSYGITEERHRLRAAPSAGALYPVELFLHVLSIEGLSPGLYQYQPEGHLLHGHLQGENAQLLVRAALDQSFLADAAVVFLLVAFPEKMFWKYGIRGYRYIYLDAGHLAQNLYLAAEAGGLAACEVAAFYDDALNTLYGFDGKTAFITTLVAVGVRK